MSLHKKIESYQNQGKRLTSLSILQDFMTIAGNDYSVDKKINTINDIIIEKYQIKYSTIVIFDGTDYGVKASNVNNNHWETLSKLHELEIFKDSITTASPKYITVNNEKEKLPYQEREFDRAKSAIFFPLYIDNVYIGYWIIESGIPHDFDNIDTTIFETVKDNIISVLKAVDYQKILESLVRKDLFTGLNSAEYLYGEGKKIIDSYTTSAICMFRVSNIEDINKVSRELGNKVIAKLSQNIQSSIAEKYIFVRYMGPKFVIVFSGVEADSVADFINEIKESTEKLKISLNENNQIEGIGQDNKKTKKKKKREDIIVSPSLNFVVATYYKGTGIEEVLKKMEKYLDEASKEESKINNI
jgi:GGDEF domain-containing protein